MKTIKGIISLNLRQSKVSYLITGILIAVGIINAIISLILHNSGSMPTGNYLYAMPLCISIFIPALNFIKTINLGGKRMDFFKAGIFTYILIAAVVALFGLFFYLTIDPLLHSGDEISLNLWDVFGFSRQGLVIAFFQMTAFLLLSCCVFHTLTLIQGRWYGWVVDALIIAVISVFTPIAPLRAALVWFFNMIIFHDIAIVQILSCLLLGAAVYCASLIPIKNKPI